MKEWQFPGKVLAKAGLLFLLANLLFMGFISVCEPGRFTLYNHLFPGRLRLPFGENPEKAYNLSLDNLDAMFASHVISQPKDQHEFRIVLIGDSSTWGTLLKPHETLAAQLEFNLHMAYPGEKIKVYNAGYPTLSLLKDALMLEQAMQYKPDLILWLTTLESFPIERQMDSPLLQQNADRVLALNQRFPLRLPQMPQSPSRWNLNLISQRRNISDLIRLQFYGFLWGATGIDQEYYSDYIPAQTDLQRDLTFEGYLPPDMPFDQLAFPILSLGKELAGDTPLIFINEPILISTGQNHDLRYNYYYPRWAYNQYRTYFQQQCLDADWICLDYWNLLPEDQFTNTAIHYSALGAMDFAKALQFDLDQLGLLPQKE